MNISYRWLHQYVEVDDAPEALAERLTRLGLEVDGLDRIGHSLDGVVVGEVENVREHPNADRLVLCDVNLGTGEPVQIACGAPNVAAGQKAPVATVGTTLQLPDRDDPEETTPVTVEARSIRGESSKGMICAEDELGLSDDHSGIMVLEDSAEVGLSLRDYLQARGIHPDDAVLDIDLTPNRPDAASHLGVARDVAADAGASLQRPSVDEPALGSDAAEQVRVEVQDPSGCPRYVAMLVRDVAVGESPLWLKRRLTAIGLRPRNNVVDVTNFVLHECGQPLHAFDLDEIAENTIVVRSAEREETVTTLDDVDRTVPEGTLLICDADRPVAVAGVMGGANSEVTASTTDVLIESAYFDPSTIRRTAKALGVQTDSSYRFERGVDRDGQRWAAARAAHLIAEIGGGTRVPGCVDAHPEPPSARTVALRPNRLRQVLGAPVETDAARRILEALGFQVDPGEEVLHCTVPTWRPDVSIEEDLIEEVARLYGYDRIPEPDTVTLPNITPTQRPTEVLRGTTREFLRGQGVREIYTNSMLRQDVAERFLQNEDAPGVVETMNPISEEMAALRPRLLPGMLDVMQFNRNHGQEALRFFEFGHVYRRATDAESPIVSGFHEHEALIVALSGPSAPTGWDTDPRTVDLFDLKGLVETLLEDLDIPDATLTPASTRPSTNERVPLTVHRLNVSLGDTPLGTVAQVHPDLADAYDLETPVFVAEFNWERLSDHAADRLAASVEPVSRFPVVERDLAVLVREDQPVGHLLDAIREAGTPLLKHVAVFDVYAGEGIEEGQKSVAFTLRFGADRTLTDEEVDEQIRAIVSALERQADATLRE
jgi:phenylalanyl-tRNA synthetase beta chain